MKIIAIARIVKQSSLIGLRLLDIDKLIVKDTSVNNIISVLSTGRVSIMNIGIENGDLKGTNGSINRLAELNQNMELVDKSPLVVVYEVNDGSYIVCNHHGDLERVTRDKLIAYANKNGIANGKIINRDGTDIVSSIKGEYIKIDVSDIGNILRRKQNYTGEIVKNKRKLYPYMSVYRHDYDSADVSIIYGSHLSTNLRYNIYDMSDIPRIYKKDIKKSIVYEAKGMTLLNRFKRRLQLSSRADIEIIARALNNKKFREQVDSIIEHVDMSVVNDKNLELDPVLKVYKSKNKKTRPYRNIVIKDSLNEEIIQDSIIDEQESRLYIEKIKKMNVDVIWHISIPFKGIAVDRACRRTGIVYTVIQCKEDKTGETYTVEDTLYLEEIYNSPEQFQNVVVRNNIMYIAGIDGVYKYDMNKVGQEYKRLILKDTASKKAKLLGIEYNARITESGELLKLKCSRVTKIPDNVLYVAKRSIEIGDCETLSIGKNVVKISENCFDFISPGKKPKLKLLEYINGNCENDLVEALCSYNSPLYNANVVVNVLGNRLSDESYSKIAATYGGVELQYMGKSIVVSDTEVIRRLKLEMYNRFDSFSWLNKKPKLVVKHKTIYCSTGNNFLNDCMLDLKELCDRLKKISSDKMKHQIDQLYINVSKLYDKRLNEGKEELRRLQSKYPYYRCNAYEFM